MSTNEFKRKNHDKMMKTGKRNRERNAQQMKYNKIIQNSIHTKLDKSNPST